VNLVNSVCPMWRLCVTRNLEDFPMIHSDMSFWTNTLSLGASALTLWGYMAEKRKKTGS
jgi:hypothetical protein